MKKNVVLLSALVAGVSLIGCGEVSSSLTSVSSEASVSSISTVSSESTVSSSVSTEPTKKIVTIADWNLGAEGDSTLLRARVARFNALSTTIEIQPIAFPGGDYNAWLTTLAAAGELPDIMMANSVADYASYGWAADLGALTAADSDWQLVPEDLRETITYGDDVLGIPVGLYFLGYFVNHDLINDVATPATLGELTSEDVFSAGDFSLDQFLSAVEEVNDLTPTDGSGYIGLDNVGEMLSWLPHAYDETGEIGHYFWNLETDKLDFLNDAVLDTFDMTKELFDNDLVYEGALTAEQKTGALGLDGWAGTLFFKGQLGFKWGGTWDTWFAGKDGINNSFNYEFVGVPGDAVVGVGDYYVLNAETEDLAATYQVAKFLTFGTAGLYNALDLIYTNPDKSWSLPGLPINTLYADEWLAVNPLKGVSELYNRVKSGEVSVLFEGNKWIPGFPSARWNFDTGLAKTLTRGPEATGTLSIGDFIWDASQGLISYEEYMTPTLAANLNQLIEDATEDIQG